MVVSRRAAGSAFVGRSAVVLAPMTLLARALILRVSVRDGAWGDSEPGAA